MSTPIWPAGLNYMPERGSWSFKPVIDSIRTDFDAGPGRVRRRFTRSTSEQEIGIVMSYEEFEVFKSFVEITLRGASRWFSVPLFQGSAYKTLTARLKDSRNPYQVAERGFGQVMVNLAVETRESTVIYDPGAQYLLELWGADAVEDFANQFQILVNQTYPAIWQGTSF